MDIYLYVEVYIFVPRVYLNFIIDHLSDVILRNVHIHINIMSICTVEYSVQNFGLVTTLCRRGVGILTRLICEKELVESPKHMLFEWTFGVNQKLSAAMLFLCPHHSYILAG